MANGVPFGAGVSTDTQRCPARPTALSLARPGPPARPLVALLAFLVLAAAVHLRAASLNPLWPIGALADADGYTRLLRVLDLWTTGAWFDSSLGWVGAPDGLALHWSRPLDVLILVGARTAVAVGVQPDAALYWSGALICPVLHILACLAAVWAARPLWPDAWCWFAGILLLVDMSALGYSIFGRADHHSAVLLCCVLGLGFALRAAIGQGGAAWRAGLAFGLGVWISPETLLVAIPTLAAFGFLWFRGADEAASAGLRIASGTAMAIAFALPLERAPSDLLTVVADRISVLHLAVVVAVAAVFAVATRLPPRAGMSARLLAGGAAAAAGSGLLLLAWPQLLRGAGAAVEDAWSIAFLESVMEMQPLRLGGTSQVLEALAVVGGVFAGLAALAAAALRDMPDRDRRAAATIVLFPLLACLAAAFEARRFGLGLAAPLAIAAAGFVPMAVERARRAGALARLPALLGAAFVALLIPYAANAIRTDQASGPTAHGAGCDAHAIARHLGRAAAIPRDGSAGEAPILLADDHNAGPALAYLAGVRAVSGPYHQLSGAFADVATALNATDEAVARAVVDRRAVDLVLVCPGAAPLGVPWDANGLRARLLAGVPPAWLVERPLPPALRATGTRLYDVLREQRRASRDHAGGMEDAAMTDAATRGLHPAAAAVA